MPSLRCFNNENGCRGRALKSAFTSLQLLSQLSLRFSFQQMNGLVELPIRNELGLSKD